MAKKKVTKDVEAIWEILWMAKAANLTCAEMAQERLRSNRDSMRYMRGRQRAAWDRPVIRDGYEKAVTRLRNNSRRIRRLIKTYASWQLPQS